MNQPPVKELLHSFQEAPLACSSRGKHIQHQWVFSQGPGHEMLVMSVEHTAHTFSSCRNNRLPSARQLQLLHTSAG